jgi:hypothetical protein
MTEQDLLKMNLHDVLIIKNEFMWVIRVPGGWIYHIREVIERRSAMYPESKPEPTRISTTSTFVPEARPLTVDYAGYEEWLEAQSKSAYPEPESNPSDDAEKAMLTVGHY